MKDKIQIRAYKKEDKNKVLQLLELNTPQYFATEEREDMIHYLDNEIEQYFVVEYQGKIVGSGGINLEKNNTIGKISWDVLHPDYQGKGIGSVLLHHRIEVIKTIQTVTTVSVRTSQMAYIFYEKNGFELLKVIKDYWAEGFDLHEMIYKG